MSTFGGLIDEISGISIDNFTGPNLNSKVFFLSHCHTDHMRGLSDARNDLPGPLYLSEVSAVFIQRKFPHLKKLKALKIGHSTLISFESNAAIDDATAIIELDLDVQKQKQTLTVTSMPAGHCPGSVMLMFETADKRVLYTGDFRLDQRAIETMAAFRDIRNDTLSFDSIHIDSTFLSLKYLNFPSQRTSVEKIIELARDWLQQNEQNVVVIRMPANYGYEFLLGHLAETFANEIHVSSENVSDYGFLPELDGCYSRCLTKRTRIHFQCNPDGPRSLSQSWTIRSIACCPRLAERYIRVIRPTAMKWTDWKRGTPIFEPHADRPETFFVCYSTHSSFNEIKQLLQFINAKCVKFNVMPEDKAREVHAAYEHIVNSAKKEDQTKAAPSGPDPSPVIQFSRIAISASDRPVDLDEDCSKRPKIKRRKRAA